MDSRHAYIAILFFCCLGQDFVTCSEYALEFSDTSVETRIFPMVDANDLFTLTMWLNIVSLGSVGVKILGVGDVVGFKIDNSGEVFVFMKDSAGTSSEEPTSFTASVGTFTHFGLTYNPSSFELKAYINAEEKLTLSVSIFGMSLGVNSFPIHYLDSDNGVYQVRNFRQWTCVLTASQLAIEKTTMAPNTNSELMNNLQFCYNLDEDTSIWLALDSSLNGMHVKLSNSFTKNTISSYPWTSASDAASLYLNSKTLTIQLNSNIKIKNEWTIQFYLFLPSAVTTEASIISQNCENGLNIEITTFPSIRWNIDSEAVLQLTFPSQTWGMASFINDASLNQALIYLVQRPIVTTSDTTLYDLSQFCEDNIIHLGDSNANFKMGELRIWTRAFYHAEIERIRNSHLYCEDFPDLAMYFKFSEDSPFEDSTSHQSEITSSIDSSYYSTDDALSLCKLGLYYDTDSGGCKPKPLVHTTPLNNRKMSIGFEYEYMDISRSYKTFLLWIMPLSSPSDGDCILNRDGDFSIKTYSSHYKFTHTFRDYLGNNAALAYTTIDHTSSATVQQKWTFIAFSKTLRPIPNLYIVDDEESSVANNFNVTLDISAYLEIGHCGGANYMSSMAISQFAYFGTFKSLQEMRAFQYRTFSSHTDDLEAYYSLTEMGGYSIVDQVHGMYCVITENWESLSNNLICPSSRKGYSEYYCMTNSVFSIASSAGTIQLYSPNLILKHSFTFEAIVKIVGTRTSNAIILKNPNCFSIEITSENMIAVNLYNKNDGNSVFSITSTSTFPSDEFHHLLITYSNNSLSIYIDSKKEIQQISATSLHLSDQTSDYIQINSAEGKLYLRELRVWSRHFRESQIHDYLFKQINPLKYTHSLRMYYPLDESTGSILYQHVYHKDQDFQSSYSTDLSSTLGISWNVRNVPNICLDHQIYYESYCHNKNRNLFFQTGSTEPILTPNLPVGNEYSIEIWAYFPEQSADSTAYYILEKQNHCSFQITQSLGIITYKFLGLNGETNYGGDSYLEITSLAIDKWHHLSASSSQLLKKSIITVDIESSTQGTSDFSSRYMPNTPFCLGGSCSLDTSNTFTGFLRDLRVWKNYRSFGSTGNNMAVEIDPLRHPTLQAYWKLDESWGITLYEQVSSANIILQELPRWTEIPTPLKICTTEESRDLESNECIPKHKHYNPGATTGVPETLGISMGTDQTSQYIVRFRGEETLLTLSNARVYWGLTIHADLPSVKKLIFYRRYGDFVAEVQYSVVKDKWVLIHYAHSMTANKYQFVLFDIETEEVLANEKSTSSPFSVTETEFECDFYAANYHMDGWENVDSNFVYELRSFDKYFEIDPVFTSWKPHIKPWEEPELLFYFKLDEGAGYIHCNEAIEGKCGTIANGQFFASPASVPADLFCLDGEVMSGGICKNEPIYLGVQFDSNENICDPFCKCKTVMGNDCLVPEGNYFNLNSDLLFYIYNYDSDATSYSWSIDSGLSFTQELNGMAISVSKENLVAGDTFQLFIQKSKSGLTYSQNYTFNVAANPSGGTFGVSPTSGVVETTQFDITFSSYTDPDGYPILYEVYYQITGEDSVRLLYPETTSSTISVYVPQGLEENSYEVTIIGIIKTMVNGFLSASQTISALANSSPKTITDYITELLTTTSSYTTQQLLIVIENACKKFIVQFIPNYDTDVCGGCNDHGTCNTETNVCTCDGDYLADYNCQFTGSEKTAELNAKTTLLEKLDKIVDYSEKLKSLFEFNDLDYIFSIIERILKNSDLTNLEIYSACMSILSTIYQLEETYLSELSISPPDPKKMFTRIPKGISQYSAKKLLQIVDNIQKGLNSLSPSFDETQNTTAKGHISNIISLQKKSFLSILKNSNEDYEFSCTNYFSSLTKLTSSNLNSVVLNDGDSTDSTEVTFPNIDIFTQTSNEEYFIEFAHYREDSNPFSLLTSNIILAHPIEITVLSLNALETLSITGLSSNIQIEFQLSATKLSAITNPSFDNIYCKFLDEETGEFSESGLAQPTDITTPILETQSYVCQTNHLSTFIIEYVEPEPIVETTETTDTSETTTGEEEPTTETTSETGEDIPTSTTSEDEAITDQNEDEASTGTCLIFEGVLLVGTLSGAFILFKIQNTAVLHYIDNSNVKSNLGRKDAIRSSSSTNIDLVNRSSNANNPEISTYSNYTLNATTKGIIQLDQNADLPSAKDDPANTGRYLVNSSKVAANPKTVPKESSSSVVMRFPKKGESTQTAASFAEPKFQKFSLLELAKSSIMYWNPFVNYRCRIARVGRFGLLSLKMFLFLFFNGILSYADKLSFQENSQFGELIPLGIISTLLSCIVILPFSFLIVKNMSEFIFSKNVPFPYKIKKYGGYIGIILILIGVFIATGIRSVDISNLENERWLSCFSISLITDIIIQFIKVGLLYLIHRKSLTTSLEIMIISQSIIL